MIYEYESPSGKKVGLDFPSGKAPEKVRFGRTVLTKCITAPGLLLGKEIVANSLPDEVHHLHSGKKALDGTPVFKNRREAHGFAKKCREEGYSVRYRD